MEAVVDRLDMEDGTGVQGSLTRHRMDIADLADLYEVYLDQMRRGEVPGPDVSMLKIYQTELFQRITEDALALAGDHAASLEPMDGNRALNPSAQFLQSRPASIYSGTNEIQRNILSKNVLELPS